MTAFHPTNRDNEATAKSKAYVEIAITVANVIAALMFVVGSVMFFYHSTMYAGTWLFVIGSVLFAVRPMIRLTRKITHLRNGNYEEIA